MDDTTLSEASVQEIQLELIRRTNFNAFDGGRVAASLEKNRTLGESAMLDRFCISHPGHLPKMGLLKLRDLSANIWNADTLYLLTPTVHAASQLANLIELEDWGGDRYRQKRSRISIGQWT